MFSIGVAHKGAQTPGLEDYRVAGLEELGLDAVAESVYRTMVVYPDEGPRQIAERVGCSGEQLQACLVRLCELALVRPLDGGESGRYRPVPPQVGIQSLLLERQAAIETERARVRLAEIAVHRLISDLPEPSAQESDSLLPSRLVGLEEIRRCIGILSRSVTSELMTFAPGGGHSDASLREARPQDQDLLDRGVLMRTVYLDSIRNHRPTVEYAAWLTGIGADVRTVPALPVRMIIFDRTSAILPAAEEDSAAGAIVLTGVGTLTALCALFDLVWDSALPIEGAAARRTRGEQHLGPQEEATLRMLAQGFTDELIARRLGVSSRTVRRIASDLMTTLGARSRFQAGARAVAQNWLTGDE